VIRRLSVCFSVLLFLASAPLWADNVQLTGQNAFDDPATNTSMSPYYGLLNGQATSFFCVDASTPVSGTASWTAFATPLTASSLAGTLQYQLTGSSAAALNNYLEMAWLITQLQGALAADNLVQAGEDQWAIWSFTGGANPYGTDTQLLWEAQQAVQNGFSGADFEILTPSDGQVGQEFMIETPEPASLLLFGVGALCLGALLASRKS
jgi:hypothetical protein